MDIYKIAPNVFVIDVDRSGRLLNYVFRFLGTDNVAKFGVDVTRKSVRDAFDDPGRSAIEEAYNFVVESKTPQFGIRQHAVVGHEFVRFSALTAPLFDIQGNVNMLIGVVDFLTNSD